MQAFTLILVAAMGNFAFSAELAQAQTTAPHSAAQNAQLYKKFTACAGYVAAMASERPAWAPSPGSLNMRFDALSAASKAAHDPKNTVSADDMIALSAANFVRNSKSADPAAQKEWKETWFDCVKMHEEAQQFMATTTPNAQALP